MGSVTEAWGWLQGVIECEFCWRNSNEVMYNTLKLNLKKGSSGREPYKFRILKSHINRIDLINIENKLYKSD